MVLCDTDDCTYGTGIYVGPYALRNVCATVKPFCTISGTLYIDEDEQPRALCERGDLDRIFRRSHADKTSKHTDVAYCEYVSYGPACVQLGQMSSGTPVKE